jgi:hypothetical protein
VSEEEREKMREAVAAELKVKLYALYTMPSAAEILGVDESTVKRWKRGGKTEYVAFGDRGIRFFGWMIVDMLLKGIRSKKWTGVERRKEQLPFVGKDRRKNASL